MGVIKQQGIKNTIISYIGVSIGFINLIFIQPRFLNAEELGLVRVLFSISALLATFLPLGISSITSKYFPYFKNRELRHYGFLGLIVIFVIIGTAIGLSILFLFKETIIGWYIQESKLFADFFYFVLPLCFILSLVYALTAYCQSLFKSTIPSFINDVLVRILAIVVVSVYYLKWIDINMFVVFFISVYAAQLLLLIFYILWVDLPSLKVDFKFLKQNNFPEILKYGLLLSITALSSLGIKYIDVIMLGTYVPLAFVGIYSVAAFIPTIIEIPLGALERISSPKISEQWTNNNIVSILKIYKESTKYLMLLGGLLLLGTIVNAPYLFQFLPSEYSKGINVVYILSLSAFINMATGLNTNILLSSKYYRYGSAMLILLLVLVIVNNRLLIPLYGMEGAAIATGVASFIYNAMKFFFIWVKLKMQPFDFTVVKIVFVIVACFVANFFIPSFDNPILAITIHSLIITILYGVAVYYLNIIPEFHYLLPWRKKGKS